MLPDIIGSLDKSGLLKEIYADLAKPGVQQVGKAIGTLLGLGNTALWRIELLNDQTRLIVQANLEDFRKELESCRLEDVVPVLPEVGVPILEKLGYSTDDTLRQLFIRLLAASALCETRQYAHPSFVWILNNLSPDESRILLALRDEPFIPYIDAFFASHGHPLSISTVFANFTLDIVTDLKLDYPSNILAYISNLTGLGLVSKEAKAGLPFIERYSKLEEGVKQSITVRPDGHPNIVFDRGIVTATEFGKLFLKAVSSA